MVKQSILVLEIVFKRTLFSNEVDFLQNLLPFYFLPQISWPSKIILLLAKFISHVHVVFLS